jgi:CheY-like chemotaxis protein
MTSSGRSGGGVTILVVDDEPSLLGLVRTMLLRAGYDVVEASGGAEALRIATRPDASIRLVLADVLMPDMNGYELAEALTPQRPGIKVLYMSGYTDKVLLESTGRSLGGAPLLRKPFTQHTLVTRIGELLESSAEPAERG